VKGSISGLFATHPPMEKRIEALQRLEAQLQGRA
jgi:heat shock protein HtpX